MVPEHEERETDFSQTYTKKLTLRNILIIVLESQDKRIPEVSLEKR